MKKKRNNKAEMDTLPPMETVAGLAISPEADISFGKQMQMGFYEYTIYERATEDGYQAGIAAHLDFIHDHGDNPPAMLDDVGFTMILNAFMPKELPAHDKAMWRAHFIAGWAAVFLGLVREVLGSEVGG